MNALTYSSTMPAASAAVPCTPAGHDCCGGGCFGDCGCSDPIGLERTRFYARQLVGPDELTQDQRWIRDKKRRHNRLLHGWGVVCGCNVTQAVDRAGRPIPWTVVVEPGDVLGPFGDEIVVAAETTYDLRKAWTSASDCPEPADPWCTDVRIDRQPRQTLYLTIRYDERLTRPVRSLGGCGCDDQSCEYSRIRETFALSALDELPPLYRDANADPAKGLAALGGALFCAGDRGNGVRPCPPCPTDPWVVLADIIGDADGQLSIDPVAHRRYVASFGTFGFSCGPQDTGLSPGLWSRSQKASLAAHLDPSAIEVLQELHGGSLDAVTELEASSVRGVSTRSSLGRFVGTSTIAEVADTGKEHFVADAVAKGVAAKRAGELWDTVRRIVRTVRTET